MAANQLVFSEGGDLAAVAESGKIKVWNSNNKTVQLELDALGAINCLRFAPKADESLLAVGSASGATVLYDLRRGEESSKWESSVSVTALEWSSDGDTLYIGHEDGTLVLWTLGEGEGEEGRVKSCKVDQISVCAIKCCPATKYLILATRSVHLFSLKKQKATQKYSGHVGKVNSLQWIDSTHFISASQEERAIHIWKRKSSVPMATLTCQSNVISCDSHLDSEGDVCSVVAMGDDGSVKVFKFHLSDPQSPSAFSLHLVQQRKDGPIPISLLGIRMLSEQIQVAYGFAIQPTFEKFLTASDESSTVVIRDVESNLLLPGNKRSKSNLVPNKVHVSGSNPKKRKVEKSEQSFEGLLHSAKLNAKERPTTESVAQLLTQAVHSRDSKLLESGLARVSGKQVKATVERLPLQIIVPFMTQVMERIEARPNRFHDMLLWIRTCLSTHLTYLSTVPMAMESLGYLEEMAALRLAAHERASRLHGKLEIMLSQISSRAVQECQDIVPLVTHQIGVDDEGSSTEWSDLEEDQSDSEETDQSDSDQSDSEENDQSNESDNAT